MACISKHGAELLRLEMLTCRVTYCEDGKILRNTGSGWKLWKKIKAGLDPREIAERRRQSNATWCAERPSFVEYRNHLHEIAGALENWFKVNQAVGLLADDVDGLYIELADHAGVECDLEDVKTLADAYNAAMLESKLIKEREAATAPNTEAVADLCA